MEERKRLIAEIHAFLVKAAIMAVTLWVIFGVVFGVMPMKDQSMMPKLAAGDLLLYYRLDRTPGDREVVVFEKEGKTHFVVMDFRNVSRLFADPDWDGPIEMNEDFDSEKENDKPVPKKGSGTSDPPTPPDPKKPKPIVDKDGCRVEIIYKTVSIYDAGGKLLRQESIIDYTKENIRGSYASLDTFIRQWSAEEKKEKIRELLLEHGIDLEALKADQNMTDVDDFDFICHVAFDKKPLTRRERAENVKKRDFLSKYSGAARDVLEALLDKYMNTGIYEIEKTEILRLDPFLKMGKPQKIASYFGGKDGYLKAVKELEQAIYEGEIA